jgi:hypothetical protein
MQTAPMETFVCVYKYFTYIFTEYEGTTLPSPLTYHTYGDPSTLGSPYSLKNPLLDKCCPLGYDAI